MKYVPAEPPTHAEIRDALLDHYDRRARDLPWRRDTDPYRILVSEIMLQQTRVETVKGYYDPWLRRFPDVETLADAAEDEVLKAWEGLGYYRRARNLHRAARVVREEHGGDLPPTYRGLRGLPGVGEYTAGAVASIAFGEVVPAVDGNVKRVLARIYDVADPKPSWLRETASSLVDPRRPGDWNQALMELGATVCTPAGPRCDACPVALWCAARAQGTQALRPAPTGKRAPPSARFALAVLHREGRVLLRKRPAEGLLGGMWAFPEERLPGPRDSAGPDVEGAAAAIREAGSDGDRPEDEATRAALRIAEAMGFGRLGDPVALPDVGHRFTHLDATYLPRAVEVRGDPELDATASWVEPSDTSGHALPVAQRKVLEAWVASASRVP